MTRENLFKAVGEARVEHILDADAPAVKKAIHWRRYAALAACLALVLAGSLALRRWGHTGQDMSGGDPSDGSAGQAEIGGPESDGQRPALFSTNVEFTYHLDPETLPEAVRQPDSASYDIPWRSEDELLDFDGPFYSGWDVAVFRGTVRDILCNAASWESGGTGETRYFSVAVVEVSECLRGDLNAGETYSLLLDMVPGYVATSLSHPLDDLTVGGDAIFIAGVTTPDTGAPMGEDGFFCYADVAQLWNFEGGRFVFLEGEDGLEYWEDAWTGLAASAPASLDDVAAYLRSRLPATGHSAVEEPRGYVPGAEGGKTSPYDPGAAIGAPGNGIPE